ncbi:MAG: 50S ribosomal protein L23 [Candidatus Moranbacteria bacterium]|nr:50S ribosomal protein L23 [Candidatus Moranbacteria bacterium]
MVATTDSVAYRILTKPRITEKAHTVLGLNKYVFQVSADATKVLVKKAVEEIYGVSVVAVNTVTIPAKKRNFGRSSGFKSSIKKAIVTLKEGDSIDLFQAE